MFEKIIDMNDMMQMFIMSVDMSNQVVFPTLEDAINFCYEAIKEGRNQTFAYEYQHNDTYKKYELNPRNPKEFYQMIKDEDFIFFADTRDNTGNCLVFEIFHQPGSVSNMISSDGITVFARMVSKSCAIENIKTRKIKSSDIPEKLVSLAKKYNGIFADTTGKVSKFDY